MESSDDAALGFFAIGPSTVLGRAIALRVLFCKYLRELLALWRTVAYRQVSGVRSFLYRRYQKYGSHTVRFLFSLLNPRNPHVLLAVVVGVALMIRRSRMVRVKAEMAFRRKFWKNVMKSALTYEEWAHAARMLEKDCARRKDADLFDEDLMRAKLKELQLRRKEGSVQDILFCLRTDLVRNLGNMCNSELHKGRFQVPWLIQEYIDEVRYHLRAVCDADSEDLPLAEKLAFIHETRHAFGRTALLLSGGASLGAFHVGVVRTLIEHHLLPRVVAGASVGSIICSVIATRTWPELQTFFGENMPTLQFFDQLGGIFTTVSRLLTRGAFHEIRRLQCLLRELTQNLTFQEAYDITGRVLGISVCSPRRHEPPRCLNYLTSPHVVIWSAVTASCAFPGLFEAQELMAKDRHGQLIPYHTPIQVGPEEQVLGARHWRDGSLESDLPMMQLKELFNVNHFIVSQANPHIAPLLRMKDIVRAYGGDFAAKLAHLMEMEVKHRCNQILELGFPMGGVAKLFAQEWEGDVTIVMPATLAQFAKIIQNPTHLELQKAVNQGRRCAWEKLSAIKVNCGIELMLDECVSELNRRRRLKRSLEKNAVQTTGLTVRSFGAKRIPSWNCLARESSWGSIDEDGIIESTAQAAGGPWAGLSIGTLKPTRSSYDGSDSENENAEPACFSWTRAGGPLMRTASATKFIQEHGGEIFNQTNQEENHSQDSSDEAEGATSISSAQGAPLPGKDMSSSKRGNKIWEKHADARSPSSIGRKSDESDTDEHEFFMSGTEEVRSVRNFPFKSSVADGAFSQLENTSYKEIPAACKVGQGPCNSNSGNADSADLEIQASGVVESPGVVLVTQPDVVCKESIAEASLREAFKCGTMSRVEILLRPQSKCRQLERGAFGSFIEKVVSPSNERDM